MALKKNYRADGTYMISDSTDNPKLGAKALSNRRESLFLDFYLGCEMAISSKTGREYKRVISRRRYLKLYLWKDPRTPAERQENKETLELAKRIRFERAQQLLEETMGYRLRKNPTTGISIRIDDGTLKKRCVKSRGNTTPDRYPLQRRERQY